MYCLVVKYNSDGIFIGEDFGEIDGKYRVWDLEDKIYKDDYPILNEKLQKKLENLIQRDPRKEFYELKDKEFYGGTIKIYLMNRIKNPIKEGQEKEVADRLIEYYKKIVAPGGI